MLYGHFGHYLPMTHCLHGCLIGRAGVPFSVVASIIGWSPSATVRMARRYGHIGQTAQRQVVNALITDVIDRIDVGVIKGRRGVDGSCATFLLLGFA
jgi:hypothetical protein